MKKNDRTICKCCECFKCKRNKECYECYSCRNNVNFTDEIKTKCEDRKTDKWD